MNICVCGNGYSGSSAVTDYLRDYDNIAVSPYDIEFMFLYDVDGIDDLRYHIVERPVRYYACDAAIKRYRNYIKSICTPNSNLYKLSGNKLFDLTDEYITQITQLSWNGWWHFDLREADFFHKTWNYRVLTRFSNIKKFLLGKGIDINPNSLMRLSIKPSNFDAATSKYIKELINLFNVNNAKDVVLDLPFPMGEYEHYRRYFSDDTKIINVIRDPRDVYILAKRVNDTYSTWIPTKKVSDFIEYYKLLCCNRTVGMVNNELTIYFEDLIYDTDNTLRMINDFLSITGHYQQQSFDPKKSINNTQLFNRYPEYIDDIRIIESELGQFLYDYSNIDIIKTQGESF